MTKTTFKTAREIEAIKPPVDGRIELTDGHMRGLKFRMTRDGAATWSLLLRAGGRQRRFQIGEHPAMSLAEARKRATQLRAEVLEGRDPAAEKRQALAEREAKLAHSVSAILDVYAEKHLARLADGRRRGVALRAALKPHLGRPLADLTRRDLQTAIDAKAKRAQTAANRLAAALAHFAGWAKREDYVAEHIGADLVKPAKEQPRERLLALEELGAIWTASAGLTPLWRGFTRLLMLTAQRRGDVAGMRWEEIASDLWSIPGRRTKNRRPHKVRLSAAAREELAALKARRERPAGLVFSTTGDTPVAGFSKLKRRLDALSGIEDWTFHDLRTAFASHLAGEGYAEGVVDRVLNHAASASSASPVARVYQQNELLEQRGRALDRWADILLRAPGEGGADNVVELRR